MDRSRPTRCQNSRRPFDAALRRVAGDDRAVDRPIDVPTTQSGTISCLHKGFEDTTLVGAQRPTPLEHEDGLRAARDPVFFAMARGIG